MLLPTQRKLICRVCLCKTGEKWAAYWVGDYLFMLDADLCYFQICFYLSGRRKEKNNKSE